MTEKTDRPVKRRFEILIGRYSANPLMRALFRIGLTPSGMALVETKGRKTGTLRRTPVNCMADGDTLWLIAQHGRHAGWVLNLEAEPQVRVRRGRRWRVGTAELLPDDDVKARTATFAKSPAGRFATAAMFRALETQPATVRIELQPS